MTHLFPTYARLDLSVKEATGVTVTDIDGKQYLDCAAGIGVLNLGHRHPNVQKAVESQLNQYWHMSNLYHMPIQETVASKLAHHSVGDYVFFANSGAEANEAAIKLARKATGKSKIITFDQSFHGRTFATMAATGQEKIQKGFGPLLETFVYTNYNDSEALEAIADDQTAAIMLEMIQGEGGVIPAEQAFIDTIKHVAQKHNILIIVDEIQTGIGRTGKRFAYEHYGLQPDIITLAKGLGNGLPIGAMVAKQALGEEFGPGSHGSTFGGNPLSLAAANEVIDTIFTDDFLKEVEEKSTYLCNALKHKLEHNPAIKDIRGAGLMVGIEHEEAASPFVQALLKEGLLVLSAGTNVIRLLPPLTIQYKEIDKAVELITTVLNKS